MVSTFAGGDKDSFLFDTGVTVDGVLHNMDVLEVKGNELHAVVLSHGHTDHTRGLMGFIKRYGRPRVRSCSTPTAYLKRKIFSRTGMNRSISAKQERSGSGGRRNHRGARTDQVIGDRALVTGQIPRTTPCEKAAHAKSH